MSDLVVAVNAGSSSIKFAAYIVTGSADDIELCCRGHVDGIGDTGRLVTFDDTGSEIESRHLDGPTTHATALVAMTEWFESELSGHSVVAVGHRVVHGGDQFVDPVVVDDAALTALERLAPLAAMHQPYNLAAIKALTAMQPDVPHVACFDTAFHQTQPDVARTFALPRDLTASGVKRYGFHGLSYEYVAGVLPELAGARADGRVVVAHLGHGASMCAMSDRRSVATTMGFTVLDGLMMGRRCGDLDPGVILYLMRERGMSVDDVDDVLSHRSGLLGVSGISNDMRDLLASDTDEAAEAIELFCYRAGRELGSLAAAIGGLDVLVFTGGIGEHAPAIRSRICSDARWLGVEIDDAANVANHACLADPADGPAVFMIPTDEALVIARHAARTALH